MGPLRPSFARAPMRESARLSKPMRESAILVLVQAAGMGLGRTRRSPISAGSGRCGGRAKCVAAARVVAREPLCTGLATCHALLTNSARASPALSHVLYRRAAPFRVNARCRARPGPCWAGDARDARDGPPKRAAAAVANRACAPLRPRPSPMLRIRLPSNPRTCGRGCGWATLCRACLRPGAGCAFEGLAMQRCSRPVTHLAAGRARCRPGAGHARQGAAVEVKSTANKQ